MGKGIEARAEKNTEEIRLPAELAKLTDKQSIGATIKYLAKFAIIIDNIENLGYFFLLNTPIQKYFPLLVILRKRNDRRISNVANQILRFAQNDVIRGAH